MQRPILIITTFLYFTPLFAQEQRLQKLAKQHEEAGIIQLEHDWINAEFTQDTLFLIRCLDVDFMAIDIDGVTSRPQEITNVYQAMEEYKKNHRSIDSFSLNEMAITLYGNTAVATFICTVHGKDRSVPFISKSRFFDVLVKRNGAWKGLASHVIRNLPMETPAQQVIRNRSAIWNTAFNNHDTNAVTSLFDTSAVLITGGARQIGIENCRLLFKSLFTRRPDITSYNWPGSIEVNEKWHVAYETGNWIESWTEKGDNDISEIKGKYCLMWRYLNGNWYIISDIFTPLQCSGSYCNKR